MSNIETRNMLQVARENMREMTAAAMATVAVASFAAHEAQAQSDPVSEDECALRATVGEDSQGREVPPFAYSIGITRLYGIVAASDTTGLHEDLESCAEDAKYTMRLERKAKGQKRYRSVTRPSLFNDDELPYNDQLRLSRRTRIGDRYRAVITAKYGEESETYRSAPLVVRRRR